MKLTSETLWVTTFGRMIKSFRHKGLKIFFETGSLRGIITEHSSKLARLLDRLDASVSEKDMNLPSFKLHPLSGKEQGRWAVSVNGIWRLTFEFIAGDAHVVDYEDYH